ncbi:hypothetical protein EYC08_16850 [Tabrizicola sp. WMC-M-20]|nr:hypothetical protein EYC08_16850 [Tabrizicola sp. WMC-M-20]
MMRRILQKITDQYVPVTPVVLLNGPCRQGTIGYDFDIARRAQSVGAKNHPGIGGHCRWGNAVTVQIPPQRLDLCPRLREGHWSCVVKEVSGIRIQQEA